MFTYQVNDELYLRMYTEDDAEELFNLVDESKNHLKEWLAWVEYNDMESSKAFIKGTLKSVAETGGYPKTLAMVYRGELAGTVGFNEINRTHDYATIGYWLSEKHQNKGIVTQAVRAMMTYGFNTIGLNRIEIRAATENKKSRGVPERLGFTKEGVVRQVEKVNGVYYDHVVYGMLKDEWEGRES